MKTTKHTKHTKLKLSPEILAALALQATPHSEVAAKLLQLATAKTLVLANRTIELASPAAQSANIYYNTGNNINFSPIFHTEVLLSEEITTILNFHGLHSQFLQKYAKVFHALRLHSVLVLAAAQSANVYEVAALREKLTFVRDEYVVFDDFHRKVLAPAARQIEEVCDVTVEMEVVQKTRNKVTKLALRLRV